MRALTVLLGLVLCLPLIGAKKKPLTKEMLYDTQKDPHEIRNLADSGNPAHQAALPRLRTALDTWEVSSVDRDHIPEAREIATPFTKEMHDWFGTPS